MCPFYDPLYMRDLFQRKMLGTLKGDRIMKGYVVESGYMGYLEGKYILFSDEGDYIEAYANAQN